MEDQQVLSNVNRNVMYPLRICGKLTSDIERLIYVRSQEISFIVNNIYTPEEWYLRDASRFFIPGLEAQGNLFADKGMSPELQAYVNLAYEFYKSISDDPPYETFVDFARVSANPLLTLRQSGIPTTRVSVATALFQYAVRMPEFYSFCNGRLPDDTMTLFKTMNPDDSFATAISPDWRREFEYGVISAQTSALDTRVKMHSENVWPVTVSYDDLRDLKAHIDDLPVTWPGHIAPPLHQSYQAALKRAVICYNTVVSVTHPEECMAEPLIGDNDNYDLGSPEKDNAPSVH